MLSHFFMENIDMVNEDIPEKKKGIESSSSAELPYLVSKHIGPMPSLGHP